ncbi:MAG: tubulin-like doman-containing protein [Candidatus Thiothrix sulfatifontis]|nr:MAG: tubulin-like doman-containing protein [Candidatus Thiothrix sulfatifontis]
MSNYLLIGLGGTGGKVLKAFRKTIYEEFRSLRPAEETGVHIKSLYVDSSRADLAGSESWRTQGDIGADISLDEESRFSITSNNLAQRLQDPEHNPVTHRYIGNPAYWGDIFSSMNISETAGGQMRRLGVALFEPRSAGFVEHVTRMTKGLEEKSNKAQVSFHVFAGLAGGTGSGSFLHVIAQLRALYRDPQQYPIYLYLLLPEPNSPWARNGVASNYYANGYAALEELNAYLVSDSKEGPNKGGPLFAPIDLTGKTLRFENPARGGETLLKDRLQGCFLVSTINEQNRALPVQEIPELIAQLVYQRIFLIDRSIPDKHRALRDAISLENLATPDEAKKSNPNVKLRSVRFQSFGMKRVVIPEEEIREHFSAQFSRQAALQMRYNHWPEHIGAEYLAEPRKISFKEFVQKEDNRQLWKISTPQVKLEAGILDDEVKSKRAWKSVQQDWEDVVVHLKKAAWEFPHESSKDVRLDVLQEEFQRRYAETFRGLGVETFYNTKLDDLTKPDRHIAEVRDTLEHWMLQEWEEGRLSATDLEVLLDDLLEDVESRLRNIPAIREKLAEGETITNEKIAANRDMWGQTGLIARTLFGKREKIFEAQAELLRELYERRSLQMAWRFAETFLGRLLAELRDKFKPGLAEFRNGLDDAVRFFDSRIAQTCQVDEQHSDLQENVIKFYEPVKVRKFVRTLLEQEKDQKAWAGEVRRRFLQVVTENQRQNKGKERYFSAMVAHGIRNGELKRVLEDVSRRNSEVAHTNQTGEQGRLVGVNIVAKMAEQFSDDKRLQQYVLDLVRSAQTFMKYDTNEFGGGRGAEAVMAVLLPECPDKAEFRKRLAELFVKAQGDGVIPHVIDTNLRGNEITLISFKYAYPLRFLQPVHDLKEKYDFRLAQGMRERALLEVHVEDHKPELPSLLRPPPGQPGKQILPVLQLAVALGLLRRDQNRQSGQWERILEVLDEYGIPQEHVYRDELVALLESPKQVAALDVGKIQELQRATTEAQLEVLQDAVETELSKEKYRIASTRQVLVQSIQQQILAVRDNRDGNIHDPIYHEFRASTQTAIERVNSIF